MELQDDVKPKVSQQLLLVQSYTFLSKIRIFGYANVENIEYGNTDVIINIFTKIDSVDSSKIRTAVEVIIQDCRPEPRRKNKFILYEKIKRTS
jgi:hypothetical protein